ncbi:DEAD/DEAH box helicase [Desulfovibrio sp. OttesenSCG-928-C06]|nr:DEAD/DEAH box helicase [Desulfovibrio sp. OttesenSCG-928-C06]
MLYFTRMKRSTPKKSQACDKAARSAKSVSETAGCGDSTEFARSGDIKESAVSASFNESTRHARSKELVKRTGSIAEYISALKASEKLGPQITSHTILPERDAEYAQTARPWPRAMDRIFEGMGFSSLYSHQAQAIDALRAGQNVVVATPTASGKSLIYTLPVIERCLHDPDARSLFLFPLKALAQDQLASFRAMTAPWPEDARPQAAVYDGDTTAHFRKKIRENPPQVILTNPEMLHLSLLPHHHLWATLFAGLSLVVVDEVHTYRGVLGSHMAQVFRRLQRVAAHYGSSPAFAFCSATVGNPVELTTNLTGHNNARNHASQPVPVLESGAPQGKRHYIFMNPLESPSSVAIKLLKSALARNLRTIVYCQSRRMTELISLWASEQSGPYSDKISAYRAGFLPEERREIEQRMSSGELLAVISTSALELGIDIGNLDLCILVGYPGTVMSTLQRGGRVGRSSQESAVVLIAGEDALDQYIVRHSKDFFNRPPEKAVLNPDNPVILERHLECAAAELPLRPDRMPDAGWMNGTVQESIVKLERNGLLLRSADGSELLAARKRPQRHVSLRGSGSSVSIETEKGELIGVVDGARALREAHPGSIYLHMGRHFEVFELDLPGGRALARPFRPSWYTRTRSHKDTDILSLEDSRRVGGMAVRSGRLRITDTVTGYEKRANQNGQLLGVTPLNLPPQVFETEGLWFQVPRNAQEKLEAMRMHFMGSIHALEHAAIGILPIMVMSDRNDFGGISTPMHAQTGHPSVFIYDGMPGGAGLSRAAFDIAPELFAHVLRAMEDCPCELGCPSCVHSPKCGSGNRPIDKEGAVTLLKMMLEESGQNHAEAEKMLQEIPGGLEKQDGVYKLASRENAANESARIMQGPEQDSRLPERVDNSDANHRQRQSADAMRQKSQTPASAFSGAVEVTAAAKNAEYSPAAGFMVLDVETRHSAAEVGGWHKAARMGVSVAVLYDSRSDTFTGYAQDEIPQLAQKLGTAGLVVGFNLLRFDYTVLEPHAPGFNFRALPTLDMLVKVHEQLSYRVSLDNLAGATLGTPKSADGLQALQWWKEQRLDKIYEYCRKDVEITRDLFLYGLEHGHLLFSNKAGQRVRVRAGWHPE